jgi:hypothetical protein
VGIRGISFRCLSIGNEYNFVLHIHALAYLLFSEFYVYYIFLRAWNSEELHNEKLHNLYPSSSIIKMTKSRKMRWAGYVARMRKRGIHIGYWWESQKEKDH